MPKLLNNDNLRQLIDVCRQLLESLLRNGSKMGRHYALTIARQIRWFGHPILILSSTACDREDILLTNWLTENTTIQRLLHSRIERAGAAIRRGRYKCQLIVVDCFETIFELIDNISKLEA